jgi:hypothetical protein
MVLQVRRTRRTASLAEGLQHAHARGRGAIVWVTRLPLIRDTILYRLSGVHQFSVAAMWRAFEECPDWYALLIERHYDSGRPIRTIIGVGDTVATLSENARMSFVFVSGTRVGFFKRGARTLVAASGKSDRELHQEYCSCAAHARPPHRHATAVNRDFGRATAFELSHLAHRQRKNQTAHRGGGRDCS